MAALCKDGDPESAFMDVTWPNVSTRASNVTLSELLAPKSGSVFGEAIARTALMSLGGTMAAPSEGGTTETSAALLNDIGGERFAAESATTGFSCGVSCACAATASATGDDLASTAFSGTVAAEDFAVSNAADRDAPSKAGFEGAAGASLVCRDFPESAWALGAF